MMFRIFGLQADTFRHLIGMSSSKLAEFGAERHFVSEPNSAPCRISLNDVAPGESVILLSYPHQVAHSPYQQSGPIFISENNPETWDQIGEIPPALLRRLLSVRAYDVAGNMIEADVTDGADLASVLTQFFHNEEVEEIHIHNAKRGCFAARAVRAHT